MNALPDWRTTPPPAARFADWLTETGSLTARLIASGRRFRVELLHLENGHAHPDEAAALRLPPAAPVLLREVRLLLNDEAMVAARSLCAADSPWCTTLDRGTRSLGLSLYDAATIAVGPLEYARLAPPMPLHPGGDSPLDARRRLHVRDGQAMLVQEVFLPALQGIAR